jgi:hypothetical protein
MQARSPPVVSAQVVSVAVVTCCQSWVFSIRIGRVESPALPVWPSDSLPQR